MVYLLEDDGNIRNFVTYALNNSGIETESFDHPKKFWKSMKNRKPDLIILDIMLPEEDGIEILKKLRSSVETNELPIMMLTAKSTEYDKVLGLDSGADDYLTKPFGTMEMISRVKALLRRAGGVNKLIEYRKGDLYLCPSKHIIKVNDEDVTLTYKEFQMLCILFENRGAVLTRNDLLTKVWGYDFDGESRTVDVHIRTLRSKLKDCGNIIETVRGIGYKIGGEND